MSCGWRKILQLRPLIREFIRYKVGDGSLISVWHDRWCEVSPLANFISNRNIYTSGFTPGLKLNQLVENGLFKWLHEWYAKFPLLQSIHVPTFSPGMRDKLEWVGLDGSQKPFSVSLVRQTICPRSDIVDWYHCIWFYGCIPRHAFHTWLIMKRRLKTQDNLKSWDNVDASRVSCFLCECQPDTHTHLFFECSFSAQVWKKVRCLAGLNQTPPNIDSIINDIMPFAHRRNINSVCAKLVVAASSYYIWQERNNRLFRNEKRSCDQVVEVILQAVRLKLSSSRWKRSRAALKIIKLWNLDDIHFIG